MSLLQDMHNEVQVLTRLAYVDTTTPVMETVMEALEEGLEAEPLPFRDPLLLALLVTSSTNLVLVLLYWAYLLYSACSHSSQPSLFPHLLLLGLALGSSSSLAQVSLQPLSLPSCLASVLLPVAYALIYSSLLVRLVYLRSLHKGVYLPALYQALLLLFTVLVQLSLTGQLLLLSRASACPPSLSAPQSDLLSLSYVLLLLLACLGLATLLRATAEHYREAKAVWAASLLSILAWVAWVSSALIFPHHYELIKDLGLEATVLAVLLVLLLPRDRRLTYLGKEGLAEYRGDYRDYRDYRDYNYRPSYWGGHNQFTAHTPASSYMGFHRPTRVVPPASSSGSRNTSHSSQARLLPFLIPGPPTHPHHGLREVYRRPTYGLPLSDVYSLSEKYRRYKQPQYYQL